MDRDRERDLSTRATCGGATTWSMSSGPPAARSAGPCQVVLCYHAVQRKESGTHSRPNQLRDAGHAAGRDDAATTWKVGRCGPDRAPIVQINGWVAGSFPARVIGDVLDAARQAELVVMPVASSGPSSASSTGNSIRPAEIDVTDERRTGHPMKNGERAGGPRCRRRAWPSTAAVAGRPRAGPPSSGSSQTEVVRTRSLCRC